MRKSKGYLLLCGLWLNKEMKNRYSPVMIYDEWCNWLIIWPFLFSYTNFVSVILDIYTYFMGILRYNMHVLYSIVYVGGGCRNWGKYFRWIPLMIYLDYFNSYLLVFFFLFIIFVISFGMNFNLKFEISYK